MGNSFLWVLWVLGHSCLSLCVTFTFSLSLTFGPNNVLLRVDETTSVRPYLLWRSSSDCPLEGAVGVHCRNTFVLLSKKSITCTFSPVRFNKHELTCDLDQCSDNLHLIPNNTRKNKSPRNMFLSQKQILFIIKSSLCEKHESKKSFCVWHKGKTCFTKLCDLKEQWNVLLLNICEFC